MNLKIDMFDAVVLSRDAAVLRKFLAVITLNQAQFVYHY